ncbi:MAG TPA: PKD domain-containing protein [Thermoleophilaceae bacterium]
MSGLREERGSALMEILLTTFLLGLVLAAALSPFQFFERSERHAAIQNDSQEQARVIQDQMIRELRNVAGQTQLIERADPYDMLFQTIDRTPRPAGSQNERNVMRVRYCLDTSQGVDYGRLIKQTQRWTTAAVPPALPSSAMCPDVGWGDRTIAAEPVTNKAVPPGRSLQSPLFTYTPGATPLTSITSIRVDIYLDSNGPAAPKEVRLTSGVYLRNQNGAPTASFTATAAGTRTVRLNASASSDPEGYELAYRWCDLTKTATCDATTAVGTAASFDYVAPASGTRSIRLVVTDVGGMSAETTNAGVGFP